MKKVACWAVLAASVLLPNHASAAVLIGGYTFDDNAFVDQVTASSGSYLTSTGSLQADLTDADPYTYAFTASVGAFLDLAFTDNVALNGAGDDVVLFETGVPDRWDVLINGVTRTYASTARGGNLNAAALDLAHFGIAAGSSVSSLRLSFYYGDSTASTSLVGALNSTFVTAGVPEPSTWALMLLGFGFIGGAMRSAKRRQRVSVS